MSRLCILSTVLLLASCADDDANTRIDITDTQLADTPDIAPETDLDPPDVGEDTTPDVPEVVRVNLPPVLMPLTDVTVRVGRAVELTAAATDPNWPDDTLAFSLAAGPVGASVNASSGAFIWFPGSAQLGPHDVTLAVTDRDGAHDEDTFSVQVIAPGSGPRLDPIADELIVLGDSLDLDAVAFDADLPEDQLSYSLALAPAGMVIDAAGKITWTPVQADLGRHDVIVEVHDNLFLSDSASFIATVRLTNRGPVAVNDYYVTPRGVTTTLPPVGVHDNDIDPDRDTLTATLVTPPTHGTLDLRPNGSFDYRPGTPAGTPFEPAIGYRFISHPSNGRDCYSQGHAAVGDVDGDGRTEVIARCGFGAGAANGGWVVMLRANPATSQMDMVWGTHTWGNGNPNGIDDDVDVLWSQPVLADLDGNGKLEIILPSFSAGHNVVLDHAGQLVSGPLASTPGLTRRDDSGFRTVADLNGDGLPEILGVEYERVGAPPFPEVIAWDRMGTRLWNTRLTERTVDVDEGIPVVVADLDLDGRSEVIADRHVLDSDGEIRWFIPPVGESGTRTFVGVANLDDDAFGEVVLTNPARGVEVRHHDGTCLWRARPTILDDTCPHRPGPSVSWPTGLVVADLNGDGNPEIVVSTFYDVFALDRDGAVVWSQTNVKIDDNAIKIDELMVFDFDGDGVMEVVVSGSPGNNSTTIFGGIKFLDGRDGSTIKTLGSSGLLHPGRYRLHMLVADIDDNGSAELLVVDHISVNGAGSPTGLFVYKSGNLPWTTTRPAWTQWSYAVTNATLGGNVPSQPAVNWLTPGLNNFRVNVPLREENGASDRFTYTTSDGAATSNEATVILDIRRNNDPPIIFGPPARYVAVGETYHQPIRTADSNVNDVVTVSLEEGPVGMALGTDGALYWATTEADLGAHRVVVSAIDTESAIAVLDFELEVVVPGPVPDVVGLTRAAAQDALEGADLVVGNIRFDDHPTVLAGAVSEQTPQGGSVAVPGTRVGLVVSTGPGPADSDGDSDTFTPNQGDCDDNNAAARPGANDPENDGIDQDCDGVDGSRPVTAIAIEPGDLRLRVGEARQLKAYGIFADGSEQDITTAVDWSASSVGGAVTSIEGGQVRALASGQATLTATRGAVTDTIDVVVVADAPTDDTPPVAAISSPVDGAIVLEPMAITGTVDDPTLVRWDLSIAPAGSSDFTTLATGTGAVDLVSGVLAELDAALFINGLYVLRLVALDAGGNESVDEVTFNIEGDQKVGLFTLTSIDLTIPMGGMPIEIARTYDSRDKELGDFGVGWNLDVRRTKVTCSSTLGEDWFVAGGGFAYVLLPKRLHSCTVRLPDGDAETFDFTPSPATSAIVPFSFLNARFTPRADVDGTLEVVDNSFLAIFDGQPGDVTLLDDQTFDPFDPERFRYTLGEGADATVFIIGPDGLESITDRNGNTLTFGEDGISHSSGAALDMQRDALGRIVSVTDLLGQTQRYAYSAAGDLASHTDVLGNVTRYYYNRDHGLVRIEDPLGRPAVRNAFDANGRLIAVTDAAGNLTTYAYDDEARTMTTTLPDGTTRVYRYDAFGRIVGDTTSMLVDGESVAVAVEFDYDAGGNPTLEVDADGVRVERAFDGEDMTREVIDPDGLGLVTEHTIVDGRLIAKRDALERVTTFSFDARGNATGIVAPGGRTASADYDDQGLPMRTVLPSGERWVHGYDTRGRLVMSERRDADDTPIERSERTLDANGNMLSETRTDLTGASPPVTTRFTYDAAGRTATITDGLGGVTRYTYDAAGNETSMTNPLGQVTTMTYDVRGLVTAITHPDLAVDRFGYDTIGRRVRHEGPTGVVTRWAYDGLSRLLTTHVGDRLVERKTYSPAGRLETVTDGVGAETRYEYDGAGRNVAIVQPQMRDGTTGQLVRPRVVVELDAAGRRTAVVLADGQRVETNYDTMGNPETTTFPDGESVTNQHDAGGRVVATTDELGHTSDYVYDAAGRLLSVTGPAVGDTRPVTRYAYDGFGRVRTRTDALNRTTAFEYDALGRQTRHVRADGTSRLDTWDVAGRLVGVLDGAGPAVTLTYDVRGRLVSRTDGILTESATWTASGQRATTTDARGTTIYGYDADDRLVSVTHPDGRVLTYERDGADQVVALDVDGDMVSYVWESGRLVEVETAQGVTRYAYDRVGREVELSLPGGVVKATSYDVRGRPTSLTWKAGNGTSLLGYTATYNARGRRQSVTELDGSVESYGYDALGRLTSATRTGTTPFVSTFVYDAVGNRVRETAGAVTTDATFGPNHELVMRGATTIRYDASGRRVALEGDASVSYEWDGFGRLASVVTEDGVTELGYDVDGRRVSQIEDDLAMSLIVDTESPTGVPQVVLEHDGEVVIATQRFGNQVIEREGDEGLRHLAHDMHGSTRALLDENAVTDRYTYLPYGALAAQSGSSDNPYRYAGERFESAIGAYDLRARMYDPARGVFFSRDPFPGFAREPISLHPYQYADDDPINLRDPYGTWSLSEISVTQAIQSTIRAAKSFQSAVRTFCKAEGAVELMQSAAWAADFLSLFINVLDSRGVQFSQTIESGKSEITVDVMPFYTGGGQGVNSLGMKLAIGVKRGNVGGSVEMKYHQGVLSFEGAAELALIEVEACGVTLVTFGVSGKKSLELGQSGVSKGWKLEFWREFGEGNPAEKKKWGGGKYPLFSYPY